MLPTRTLGTQGLTVPVLGLGLMGMSHAYGTAEERDEPESIATIHRAIELGCTFLDTAEAYGPYKNEELLARALKQLKGGRDRVVIGLVAFAPLGRGFLTGNVKRAEEYPPGDFRRGDPRYQGANFDANVRAAESVRELAARKAVTAGQIALAWLLHKGDDIVPIPGTKRRKYLEENVHAADVSLTSEEMGALDAALAPGKVSGPRYAPAQLAQVDR